MAVEEGVVPGLETHYHRIGGDGSVVFACPVVPPNLYAMTSLVLCARLVDCAEHVDDLLADDTLVVRARGIFSEEPGTLTIRIGETSIDLVAGSILVFEDGKLDEYDPVVFAATFVECAGNLS